jgi:hypothetical protein
MFRNFRLRCHCWLFVLSLAGSGSALAQKPYALELEDAPYSPALKQELREQIVAQRRAEFNELIELHEQQGSIGLTASCPTGFVHSAQVHFTQSDSEHPAAMTLQRDEGSNCDGPRQCRSWTIAAEPEDSETAFDVALRLNCSNEDALRSRARTPEPELLPLPLPRAAARAALREADNNMSAEAE